MTEAVDAQAFMSDDGTLPAPVLVLGLGNMLLQDEGVGVRVIERLLDGYRIGEGAEVLDGGTAGMSLLGHLMHRKHVIVIDAVKTGSPPGTVVTLRDEEVPAFFQSRVSPHQLALSDVLATLTFTDDLPPALTVIGVEPEQLELGLDFSPSVAASVDTLLQNVLTTLRGLGIEVEPLDKN